MYKKLANILAVAWFILCCSIGGASAQLDATATYAGTAGGTANAALISVHNVGQASDILSVPIRFFPSANNTGATTLQITLDGGGSIGPLNILKVGQGGTLVALSSNDLRSTQLAEVIYDGTEFLCNNCFPFIGLGYGLTNTTGSSLTTPAVQLTNSTNALVGDVAISSTGIFIDGPTISVGTTGTWLAMGTVTFQGTAADAVFCKLWDGGSNVGGSSETRLSFSGTAFGSLTLLGPMTTASGTIKISCRSDTSTSIVMKASLSGAGKDTSVTAVRLQ